MGREPSPSDVEIKIPPQRGDNVIHPSGAADSSTLHSMDYRPSRKWFPWLVPSFVAVNVITFVITMYINNCPKNSVSCVARFLGRLSFQPFNENRLLGPSSPALQEMGALEVNKVVHDHQAWRLITCIWLHAGVLHLFANMLSLLFIGIQLEQEFGFVRIGMIYVLSGFGGSLLSSLFIKSSISVGASGALFGLLGAMLSELILNWTIYVNKFAALLTLVFVIVISLAVGILPHVDNFAHIGGFVSGCLLGFVLLVRPQFGWVNRKNAPPGYCTVSVKSKFKTYQYILWLIALILLIIGFTVGLVMLFRGVNGNEHCSWCHYLSCVPTSRWKCQQGSFYCMSTQTPNQLNVTCQSNGRTQSYPFSDASEARIRELCIQVCS